MTTIRRRENHNVITGFRPSNRPIPNPTNQGTFVDLKPARKNPDDPLELVSFVI